MRARQPRKRARARRAFVVALACVAPWIAAHSAEAAPSSLVAGPLESGCLAVSRKERAALCVLGGGSIQSGESYDLIFVGASPQSYPVGSWRPLDFSDHPLRPSAPARAAAEARIASGAYVPVATLADATVSVGSTASVSGVDVRVVRRKSIPVSWPDGSWDDVEDELAVRVCKGAWRTLHVSKLAGPSSSDARVWAIDEDAVVVEYDGGFVHEGDAGGHVRAFVVDGATCSVFGV